MTPQLERDETDVAACEISGTLPAGLQGDFVRVGGEWFFPPLFADDAPLNSDGYISRFRFDGNTVAFRGRWVRTPRFEANLRAGRQLYGYYRNAYTDDPAVRNPDAPQLRTVANTAPIVHAGKLFALKEDGLPLRIDPDSLETLGAWDFAGRYAAQTFTAHPKIDPLSGEMIAYGYEATGAASDDLFLYTIDPAGAIRSERHLKVPYVSMVHDVALTERHVIIPFCGYVTSRKRLKHGQIHWGWDRSKPSYVGILPRDGEARDVRWFRGPERCMMHTFNAHTEGSTVTVDAAFWNSNFFPFFPNVDGSPFEPQLARAFIRRLRFDLNASADTWTEETLFPMDVDDRGRIDPRYLSLHNRYGFTGFHDPQRPLHETVPRVRPRPINAYGRFDFEGRTFDAWSAQSHLTLQECCFVPRHPDGEEGDGYLIGVADNHLENRSELIVLDAQHLGNGPLARAILPFRSTAHIHGTWVSASELAGKPESDMP